MDLSSSQLSGDPEFCSSSESGWTMYLASPMHDGSNGDDDDDDDNGDDDGEVDGNSGTNGHRGSGDEDRGKKEDDDDSMASDASSGTPYKQWHHDANLHAKYGNIGDDEAGGVVMERNSQCSSRHSRKNHGKVERGAEKGVARPSDPKVERGGSVSIYSSSKMRRSKSRQK